jgi:replicative DNA helicase
MSYDIIVGRGEADKKEFGDKGLVFLGKGFVKMGQYTSLSNKIYMDIARSHVVLVAGKRGSGKSITSSNIFVNQYENGNSSIYFSIEMTAYETNQRNLAILADVNLQNLKQNKLTDDEILKVFETSDFEKLRGDERNEIMKLLQVISSNKRVSLQK